MKRDLGKLTDGTFDIAISGAGIYGACVARDAALRGLKVALVDRGDFGCGTSHNSLKLIHGGLRYLQHFDFLRVRSSISERKIWLKIAPHLIRPLEFVIPTYGYGTRGREALWSAMKLYELLCLGQNRDLIPQNQIPRPRVISKSELLEKTGGLDGANIRGGATWHDGQMLDADRVLLETVQDAQAAGAVVANYVETAAPLEKNDRVYGLSVKDNVTGTAFEISAKLTVNTCGPWASAVTPGLDTLAEQPVLSKCMNLVVNRQFSDSAFGVKSLRKSDAAVGDAERLFFFTPWKNCTIIGTSHEPYKGRPDDCVFSPEDVQDFMSEIANAYPTANLSMDDVCYVYQGLTPAEDDESSNGEVKRMHSGEIVDHAKTENRQGLISVFGEKYTTARLRAEKIVDLAIKKLGISSRPCAARYTPLPGARGYSGAAVLLEELRAGGFRVDPELISKYGARCKDFERESKSSSAFQFQVLQGIRSEMAIRLTDVIYRRTDYAVRGQLTEPDLNWCAETMATELGWSETQKQQEINAVRSWPQLYKNVASEGL